MAPTILFLPAYHNVSHTNDKNIVKLISYLMMSRPPNNINMGEQEEFFTTFPQRNYALARLMLTS